MEKPSEHYWISRRDRVKHSLEANGFEVFLAQGADEAVSIVLGAIIPGVKAVKVAWGGSKTFRDTGLYRAVREAPGLEFLDPFGKGISLDQSMDLRRKALLSDLFITGTNAVTETGHLVNLDRTGNRVAAISFGPKWVAILAGRNKIVPDLVEAVRRVKTYAAPLVTMWLGAKTPCTRTGVCQECRAPERVCNTWSILEKSHPEGRVKVILINDDLGF
jgi:L-lactate utilization protein LutB